MCICKIALHLYLTGVEKDRGFAVCTI